MHRVWPTKNIADILEVSVGAIFYRKDTADIFQFAAGATYL